jgi:DNA-binding beta-propeller fold protein YncE
MECLVFVYKWKSRDLRRITVSILKSWVADNVKKINYVQSYLLKEWKNIEKNEEKILLIYSQDKNKLLDFLTKNFPQIEKININ